MYRRSYKKPNDPMQEQQPEKKQRLFPAMTMTVDEMAEELNISRPTAYDLVKQTGFPAFHIGQRIIVNREGLQRWINQQCEAALA